MFSRSYFGRNRLACSRISNVVVWVRMHAGFSMASFVRLPSTPAELVVVGGPVVDFPLAATAGLRLGDLPGPGRDLIGRLPGLPIAFGDRRSLS